MRLLVFGATGSCGILVIREALAVFREITIVVYARSLDKLPDDLRNNPSVILIKGELDDLDTMAKAMEGVDAVTSSLGPPTSPTKAPFYPSGTPLAKAYGHILDLMVQNGVRRIIVLGTASITDPADKFDLQFAALVNGVATLARNAYKDVVAIGEAVRGRPSLDWTIVRVPLLNNKDTKDVRGGYIGDGKTRTTLSRAGYAAFVIAQLNTELWVRAAPLICSV